MHGRMTQEEFELRRKEFYDSLDSYNETLRAISDTKRNGTRAVADIKAWLPSPEEVQTRLRDVRWLYAQGFSLKFVVSVMHHDMPTVERVRQAIANGRTAEEIMKQFKPFLINSRF